ncbi:MAG: PQQ-binding-like beta-propeller repeat protein [Anaerolineae bacterium]|jgi:outer membrane protein assembly factor BamB
MIKRRAVALVLMALAVMLAGCMGRGSVMNAGWTVAAERDGTVYAALATGYVLALDASQQGALLWQYPETQASTGIGCSIARPSDEKRDSPLDAVYGRPLVLDDVVVVGSFDGKLQAFKRDSGAPAWTYAAEQAIIGAAVEADGVLYFGSSDGKVYAIDAATQEPAWAQPFSTRDRVWGAPAIDGDRLYVASMDHSVYAIDRNSGQLIWEHNLGASAPGALTLTDGRVFVGSVDRYLTCLSADDGSELWRSPQYAGWVWGEALVVGDGVYFGSLDGMMHALNVDDGQPLWADVPLKGAIRAGPALAGDTLLVGTEKGYVYTVGLADGASSLLFGNREDEELGPVLSTPVVEGNLVYVTTSAGRVVALDLTLRDPMLWVYPPVESK